MQFRNTTEYWYYSLMRRWENTAPRNLRHGYLDGSDAVNSQIERLMFILRKISVGNTDRVMNCLSVCTRRNDGRSYISDDHSWMKEPELLDGKWYIEKTISLIQKHDIIQCLVKVGISPALVAVIDDFVEGKDVAMYQPTVSECLSMLEKMLNAGEIDQDEYAQLVASCSSGTVP